MKNVWFTSDFHLSHDKPFLWEPRGFSNIKEMNEAIVENWNSVIKPDDDVYNLGDLALNDMDEAAQYLKQLNGRHWWIFGNHDSQEKIDYLIDEVPNLYPAGYAWVLHPGKYKLYLSHYPALTSNYDDKKFSHHVINLHGHTHQRTNWLHADNPFMYHIGVDSHNYTPVNLDEVITDIRNRWVQFASLYEKYKEDTYGEVK